MYYKNVTRISQSLLFSSRRKHVSYFCFCLISCISLHLFSTYRGTSMQTMVRFPQFTFNQALKILAKGMAWHLIVMKISRNDAAH